MPDESATHRAARLAAIQHGRVSIAQLRDCGFDPHRVSDLVAAGWLHPVHAGVYAVGHPGETEHGRWIAAQLALDGALSHRSAGALWRILDSELLEVTVATLNGRARRDGIVPHRQFLGEHEICVRRGIRVTTLPRTILDLAAVLPQHRLERAFEQAQALHHMQPVVVGEAVLLRRGFRGTAKLRRILADAVDPALVRSVLELRFFALCAEHGLPRPENNVRIGPWEVDFLWPDARLVVETDGRRWHTTAAARRRAVGPKGWRCRAARRGGRRGRGRGRRAG